MARQILTKTQRTTLEAISTTPLAESFYFTGGTALAHYYLEHRLSEDLDFFSESEFEPQDITSILKSLKPKIDYTSIDYKQSFNRHLYMLNTGSAHLKLEFTYFPFPQIENPINKDGLKIDSLTDIAVNKLFTIAQNPRGRDYYDLYAIIEHTPFALEDLRQLAKQKFDWHVDPLQLASQFNRIESHFDDPILTKKINRNEVVKYFKNQALSMKDEILK